MSPMAIAGLAFGVLSVAALLTADVSEFLRWRLQKTRRPDEDILERRRKLADAALVAAWLCMAAAFLCLEQFAPDRLTVAPVTQPFMTWVLIALVALDIPYLLMHRTRPKREGQRKFFWER